MNAAPATDWEEFFEAPGTGLIPRIEAAKDSANLSDICCTFVEKLYTRRGDARMRDRYRDRITSIFEGKQTQEEKLAEVIGLLREMKNDRIVRAGKRREERSLEEALHEYDDSAGDLFASLVLQEIQNVFDLLSDGIKPIPKRPMPYFVAKEFGAHLKEIVREDFMPELLNYNRRMIAEIENLPPEKREAAINQTFGEKQFRESFADSWRWVWSMLTTEADLPEKPQPKQRNIIESLKSRLMGDSEFEEEFSIEDWQEAVKEAEARNEKAQIIWAKIKQPSDHYDAPSDADRMFIGDLIIHPYGETQKLIGQLAQMASQKVSAKVFYELNDGKDLDLALLLASMRYPKLFLVSKDAFLMDVMRGLDKKARRIDFPRVNRYLLQKPKS